MTNIKSAIGFAERHPATEAMTGSYMLHITDETGAAVARKFPSKVAAMAYAKSIGAAFSV